MNKNTGSQVFDISSLVIILVQVYYEQVSQCDKTPEQDIKHIRFNKAKAVFTVKLIKIEDCR